MLRKVIFGVLFSSLLFSVSADAGRNGIGVTACQQIGSGPPFTGDGFAYCTSYTYFNDLINICKPRSPLAKRTITFTEFLRRHENLLVKQVANWHGMPTYKELHRILKNML